MSTEESKLAEPLAEQPQQLSKKAQKRLAKKAARQAAKQAAREEKYKGQENLSDQPKPAKIDEGALSGDDYFKYRSQMLEQYAQSQAKNNNDDDDFTFYPSSFTPNLSLKEFIKIYDHEGLLNGDLLKDKVVKVVGRIEGIRESSKKLFFFHIWQAEPEFHIQVLANYMHYQNAENDFYHMISILRRGDIVGITGYPSRSKRGELSIVPQKVMILSPCLRDLPHPNKAAIKDPKIRYGQRYLDLQTNLENRKIFQTRSRFISELRSFLNQHQFMEVETPILNKIVGGATAKPFKTHHEALDIELFMRIAPELYLKQCIISGFDRVYEIGKNFRNEGIDLTHNPEFTACEFYQAYANYQDLMTFTEKLLFTIVKKLNKDSPVIKFTNHNGQNMEIDFTPPFARIDMLTGLKSKVPELEKLPDNLSSEQAQSLLDQVCITKNIECSAPRTTARLIDKLVGEYLEPDCQQPTFIINHPQVMSPLAKPNQKNPHLTDRFELFAAGWELANAYTELNDPQVQAERFAQQVIDKNAGDQEAQPTDQDFITALEYGLPPTAGWGMGIDRMVMLLTNKASIKEVLLFPLMKSGINE